MHGHSSVFSTLPPGPSHLFFNWGPQHFLSRNSWVFSCSAVAMLFTYNETEMRLNFECLLPSFLYSLQAVCLPACVGTCAEGSWLGILQTLHRSHCAVLQTASDPETTDYEIPVGQTEWSRRGVKKAIQILLSFSCQLYKTRFLQLEGPTDFVVLQPHW